MDQESAFLAEIAAHPDDNGTRLVYADCLWGNRIGDEGLAALCQSPFLKGLTALELGENSIGTIWPLLRSPAMSRLTRLSLDRNQVTEQALRDLSNPSVLPRLLYLKVYTHTAGSLLPALRKRFGARLALT